MLAPEYTPHSPKPIENAMCPQCQRPMGLVRIDRLVLGYHMRTFECPECKREEMVVVKQA